MNTTKPFLPLELHQKEIENGQTVIDKRIILDEIDQNVKIYTGPFKVVSRSSTIYLEGHLYFSWYPKPGVTFSGQLTPGQKEISFSPSTIEVYVGDQLIGRGWFTNFFDEDIKGRLAEATTGDKKRKVNKIAFSVPNLRSIEGLTVETKDGTQLFGRKILLDDDEFIIEILRLDTSDMFNLQEVAEKGGGYWITYVGEMHSKRKYIDLKKLDNYLNCLNSFLSFLNGQKISVVFKRGYLNSKLQWTDYIPSRIDPYLEIPSWAPTLNATDFNECWKRFLSFWKTDQKLLTYGLHWYFEANRNAGLLEGSLILAQTAIETFCNWIVLEKLEILKGNEAKNLSTTNKIRILLNVLGIDPKVPARLKALKAVKHPEKSKITFNDGPEALTEIRNMLTHGSTPKYKSYDELDSRAVYEAKQLCLWYIEVSLLFCFGYREQYHNRVSDRHEYPPYLNRSVSL